MGVDIVWSRAAWFNLENRVAQDAGSMTAWSEEWSTVVSAMIRSEDDEISQHDPWSFHFRLMLRQK